MPVLIIDNYDSFTFNLVNAVAGITGEMPIVVRNDEKDWQSLQQLDFDAVIISPGPGRPDRENDFGVSGDAILHAEVPVLGVCLGHQGIAYLFGGTVAEVEPVHGYASEVIHTDDELFRGIPERFSAIRYHSLAVSEPLPPELKKIAWSTDGTLMALRHVSRPIWGVQFHPESISTGYGVHLLRNFLAARARSRSMPCEHLPEVLFRELFSEAPYAFWLDRTPVTYMGASTEIFTNELSHQPPSVTQVDLPFPFRGGYVGYFGYEWGQPHKHPSPYPDSLFLRVDRFLAIDHRDNTLWLVGDAPWRNEIECRIRSITPRATPKWNRPAPAVRYRIARDAYLTKIRECLRLIRAGESYELCLTNQVCLESEVPALDYYETLRRINPAPYSAFLKLGDIEIASTSPECFLRIDENRHAESRPIKGTIRRGRDGQEDAELHDRLANDTRFRAENLMIVDLVRHDLSRVCEVGSVHVPRLMEVETYPTVHQLVSTIAGRLRLDVTIIDCIRSLFPGGSMTGAPKKRSVELLDQLEPAARGIYSGVIGYIGDNGTADFSMVIRTAVFHNGHVTLGVGGAIVAQSDPAAEWEEMELKAKALLRAFDVA